MITDDELIARARSTTNPRRLSPIVQVGGVASALLTDRGNVYTGVCIDTACSMGFCAEHAAIAAMVTNGESKISTIVAVNREGNIISPCGRCREFIYQINDDGGETRVILRQGVVKLSKFLPEHWLSEASSAAQGGNS